jgi:protein SCO1
MFKRGLAYALALAAISLAACENGGGLATPDTSGGGGGGSSAVPADTIGISIPTGTIGIENDPVWGAIGGFTQSTTSQVLAFPPGTKITLQNLSSTDPHTFNVIALSGGPPPKFPANPNLSFTAAGHGQVGTGFASGIINPMQSVTVTLSKPGTYLVGCAFHYLIGMRDVLQVSASATPGPQASPGPTPKPAAATALVDQNGRHFTLASLAGAPTIVTFVSAHCTDACPLINAQFAAAARALKRRGSSAHLVTITLDPEHDPPSLMRAMARTFGADPHTWLVASGRPADVNGVARAFGVVAIAGKSGYREQHTTFVYELDPTGKLVKTTMASSDLADTLVQTLSVPQVAVKE